MNWRQRGNFHWSRECGRYTVCRSLAFDKHPAGHWVYLAFYVRVPGEPGECVSPERRDTLEEAVADASACIRQGRSAA